MHKNNLTIEQKWLRSIFGISVQVIEQHKTPDISGEELYIEIIGKLNEPEDLEWAAIPLLFTLAFLSFSQARPRGYSFNDYEQRDEFLIEDFITEVKFVNGKLSWHGDYLKGRRMKTDILIDPNGTFKLTTYARGEGAIFWINFLNGIAPLSVVK